MPSLPLNILLTRKVCSDMIILTEGNTSIRLKITSLFFTKRFGVFGQQKLLVPSGFTSSSFTFSFGNGVLARGHVANQPSLLFYLSKNRLIIMILKIWKIALSLAAAIELFFLGSNIGNFKPVSRYLWELLCWSFDLAASGVLDVTVMKVAHLQHASLLRIHVYNYYTV